MKKGILILTVLLVIVALIVALFIYLYPVKGPKKEVTALDREKGMCSVNENCHYFWYAGGCFTVEKMDKVNEDCKKGIGACLSAAPPRENVTCTCENYACVTHG